MRFKGFIGQSYNLRNTQYDCQRTVNWYPEVDETGLGKEAEQSQLIPTPGLAPLISGLNGGSRGGYLTSNGYFVWVFGNTLYLVTPGTGLTGWTARALDTNIAGSLECFFTDNGISLFMLADGNGYAFNLITGAKTVLSGGGWAAASSMTYFDTYIVFSKANSNQFFWTNPLSTTVDALDFATGEANSDQIVAVFSNNEDLWVFGKKSTELWYDYGTNNTTFQRRPSILIETGCAAPRSIKKLNNTIFWLTADDRGGPTLVMANGYAPQRVSTFPIEQEWMKYSADQIANSTAYTYQDGGHHFYVLNIPGQQTTWVYDMTASLQLGGPVWHERQSRDTSTETQQRHYSQGHAYVNGVHVTGDYQNGVLYAMDNNTFTDNGEPILRERTTPHITNSMDRIYYGNMTIDFLTGSSLDMTLDPQIMMQFSDDGGFTWSDERWETAGMTGQYGVKVQFPRLGAARSRVFRIRCSDPIYWAVSGADLEMRPGTN